MLSSEILVVDDDADIRESLMLALELEGFDVAAARNGGEAWGLLSAGELPGLVLLDLAMPVVDGATLLARMRDDQRLRHVPVVILTAFTSPSEAVTALAEGCLRKPVDLEAVMALAAHHCGRRQAV